MNTIRLQSMRLSHWRGFKRYEATFGESTMIIGHNASGKSTILDAFVWALTGKDSQGRTDHGIKHVDPTTKKTLDKVNAEVEITLLVNGKETTLKRTYIEEWVKPRGQVAEVFKGHKTEYTIDGVCMSKADYTDRVSAIIPEDILLMLVSPERFFGMGWREQRNLLTRLVGTEAQEAVRLKYQDLLGELSDKDLEDERKRLMQQRKRLTGELDEIAPRIDQMRKTMPEAKDWGELEERRDKLEASIDELGKAISGMSVESDTPERIEARGRLTQLREEAERLEAEERTAHEEANKALEAQHRDLLKAWDNESAQTYALHRSAKARHAELEEAQARDARQIAQIEAEVSDIDERLGKLRREFEEVRQETSPTSGVCPTCLRALPEDVIREAEERWLTDKNKRLAHINAIGRELVATKQERKELIHRLREEMEARAPQLEEAAQAVEETKKQVAQAEAQRPQATRLAPYEPSTELKELRLAIERAEADYKALPLPIRPDTTHQTELRKMHEMELRGILRELGERDLIAKAERTIQELEARGREIAEHIATIESREDAIRRYTFEVLEAMEQEVNSHFSLVQFRLFDSTIEGNVFEACIPHIEGVPYSTANRATQVNSGIDVVNAFAKGLGYRTPLFVDNAESVQHLMQTEEGVQLITMRVDDTPLCITH